MTTGARRNTSTSTTAGPMKSSAVAFVRHHAAVRRSRGSAIACVRAIGLPDDELVPQLSLELFHRAVHRLRWRELSLLNSAEEAVQHVVVDAELRVVRDELRVVEHVLGREQELVLLVRRVVLLRREDGEVRAGH